MNTALDDVFIEIFVNDLRKTTKLYNLTSEPSEKRRLWNHLLPLLGRLSDLIDPAISREKLFFPLADLGLCLLGLDLGAVDPALRPAKLTHRVPDPRWARFRGGAAAASQILMQYGVKASDADTWVAEELSRGGYEKPGSRGGTRIKGVTIYGWRKEAREGSRSEFVRAAYDYWINVFSIDRVLSEISNAYPETSFKHAKDQRIAGIGRRGMLHALYVIDSIVHAYPPPKR